MNSNRTAARHEVNQWSHLPPGTPVYRLLLPWFGPDDTLHPEDEEVAFTGAPNEFMEPLNDAARAKMTTYLEELEDGARAKAQSLGRPFTGRITDLGEAIMQAQIDAKREANLPRKDVVMPARKGAVPVRGDTLKAQAAKKASSGILATRAPKPERDGRRLGPTEIIGITDRMSVPAEPGAGKS